MLAFFALLACLFGQAGTAQGQTETNAEAVLELPLVAPSAVPTVSTFWLWSGYEKYRWEEFGPPIPSNPWGTNVDVFSFTNDYGTQFIIDDRPIVEAQAQAAANGELQSSMTLSSESEQSPDSGGGMYGPMDLSSTSNALWLEVTGVTSAMVPNAGMIYVTVHGTVENQTYEILSKESLTNSGWLSEGTILAAAGQDWTPTTGGDWDKNELAVSVGQVFRGYRWGWIAGLVGIDVWPRSKFSGYGKHRNSGWV